MNKITTLKQAYKATGRDYNSRPKVVSISKDGDEPILEEVVQAVYDLLVWTEALNLDPTTKERWIPDWGNYNERKHYPWFFMGGSDGAGFRFDGSVYVCTYSYAGVGSRFSFRSEELSVFAATHPPMVKLYKKIMVVPKK